MRVPCQLPYVSCNFCDTLYLSICMLSSVCRLLVDRSSLSSESDADFVGRSTVHFNALILYLRCNACHKLVLLGFLGFLCPNYSHFCSLCSAIQHHNETSFQTSVIHHFDTEVSWRDDQSGGRAPNRVQGIVPGGSEAKFPHPLPRQKMNNCAYLTVCELTVQLFLSIAPHILKTKKSYLCQCDFICRVTACLEIWNCRAIKNLSGERGKLGRSQGNVRET